MFKHLVIISNKCPLPEIKLIKAQLSQKCKGSLTFALQVFHKMVLFPDLVSICMIACNNLLILCKSYHNLTGILPHEARC